MATTKQLVNSTDDIDFLLILLCSAGQRLSDAIHEYYAAEFLIDKLEGMTFNEHNQ